MNNKLTVAVVFGGKSSEHDVSCMSGVTIMKALDREKYDVILIGITKDGHWLLADSIDDVESGAWRNSKIQAIISPDAQDHGLILSENGTEPETETGRHFSGASRHVRRGWNDSGSV